MPPERQNTINVIGILNLFANIQQGSCESLAFSPDGRLLAAGYSSGEVVLYDAQNRREIHRFSGDGDCIKSVAFSSNGQFLAAGSDGNFCVRERGFLNTVKLWNLNTKKSIQLFSRSSTRGFVRSVAFSPDSEYLAAAYHDWKDGQILMWNVNTGKCVHVFNNHESLVANVQGGECLLKGLSSVSFSPDGKFLAALWFKKDVNGADARGIVLWDLETKRCIRYFADSGARSNTIAFSVDSSFIVAAGGGVIKLFDLHREYIYIFFTHNDFVESIAFSPDNQFFVVDCWNCVKLFNIKTGNVEQFKVTDDDKYVNAVAYSPLGTEIVAGLSDGTIVSLILQTS
ncbi:MAG: WD40 repeat domain-containing protein [Candidatus Babeliales bacterium]